jgi:N,N'-diacetyllegionaminate synthase
MNIGTREIGAAHPPYVIAELGVNHDGSLSAALKLVDAARQAGADAVKLQWFDAHMLLSKQAALANYQTSAGERDPYAMLQRLQLGAGAMARVFEYAQSLEMQTIVTVFSVELVDEADELPWDAYKIASPDIVNRPLIDRIRATGEPTLLSAGAATLDEVACAVKWLGDHPFMLLQCVSAYPTPDEHASLGGIRALAAEFPHPSGVGYSDHTTALDTGALAVTCGACLLEKHLTLDRNSAGPDHAASLDPDGFADYVRLARRAFNMIGPLDKDVLDIEREVRSLSRQSVTTKRDLAAGHVLAPADLTVKRPGTGLPAAALGICVGRKLKRSVAADTQLTEADLT